MEVISVPIIVAVVYGVVEGLKQAIDKEWFNKVIPILSLVLGALLGLACFYLSPANIPASDVFVALVIGGLSGWGATATNQTIKQLLKKEYNENEENK